MTQSGIVVDIGINQGGVSCELGRNMGFRGYRFLEAHRFAVHLTTKTAQSLLMKAFIGTSGLKNALAERSI